MGYGALLFGIPGGWELLIVGGIILLLFFGRRIPEVMRSLGQGVTQFKKGLREDEAEAAAGEDAAEPKKSLPAPEREVEAEVTKQAEPAEDSYKRDPK
ncbi:MAG: twin-arginine translocase TatA/TatE family subunit [Planctomycetota bacterium]